ncbi:MAG: S8 family serine peptidase [Nocardioides sp.]|uniref:S8 family serine peptidase n=1 Tax=Nocardioides sp. TaxID=35761 RepID=UPI0039E22451
MQPRRLKSRAWAGLVAVTAAATALSIASPAATAAEKKAEKAPMLNAPKRVDVRGLDIQRREQAKDARVAFFVQFAGEGAADAARRTGSSKAAKDRRGAVSSQAKTALATARKSDSKATSLFVVSNALPGMGVRTTTDGASALAAMSGVVKVSRIIPKTATNANTAQLVKALDAWKYAGGTGEGVRIGIIDTGIDYTHADFGGPGTTEAYDDAQANSADPDWRDALPAKGKAKIRGGHDFVGDAYDADDPTSVPQPDENPLDCNEHGTHVAGTAAGYGVKANGSTFNGDYADLSGDDLMDMEVGPGMAPEAELYGLKVFGCDGTTDEVIPALDWALDPNGDGNFDDHLDMINMSLGADYGNEDDPENAVVNKLAKFGVLPVISMGNNGDLTDTGGAPGNAISALAVASSVDSYQLRDGLTVNAPGDVAGTSAGQMSVAYDWADEAPVTGDVVAISEANADGCDVLSGDDAATVAGKVAWLIWDDDDATRRCGSAARAANVKSAGAIGAIFTSGLNVFGAGITGDADIPVFQLPKSETDKLQPAVTAGTLNVTFDGALQASIRDVNPGISDTLSSFSSRGPRGSIGVVKPDVTAPGDTIASAGMGSGDKVLVISGTSMASPLTAGIAAIVKAKHPSWTPLMVKAAVMNNATHDVWTGENQSGTRYAPARVGSGRVDALAASDASVLAYVNSPANAVSASFGPVPVPVTAGKVSRTKKLVVKNTGADAVTVNLAYQSVNSSPGVSYSVSPKKLVVGAGAEKTATITMTIQPRALRHTLDKTMDREQVVDIFGASVPRQFVTDSSGRVVVTPVDGSDLRVPVYGGAKPVSTTKAKVTRGRHKAVKVTGAGVKQGSGASAFRSLMSVMQLGAKSGKLPTCGAGEDPIGCTSSATERAGDIKEVGAGATKKWLWFGVSTRSDWPNIGSVLSPDVYYDVNGDGTPDFDTYVGLRPGTDVPLAFTFDMESGDLVDAEPINFNFGDVDTNVFDNNVVLLPVWKDAIGLKGKKKAQVRYSVGMWYGYTGDYIDWVDVPGKFNAGKPAVATGSPLWLDRRGKIKLTSATPKAKALVFHLHGASGKRSQVLTVPKK